MANEFRAADDRGLSAETRGSLPYPRRDTRKAAHYRGAMRHTATDPK